MKEPDGSDSSSKSYSGKRWFLSFLVSMLFCFTISYYYIDTACKFSMISMDDVFIYDARFLKGVLIPFFIVFTIFSMPVYDIVALVRFRCGWDTELQDLELRPGGPFVSSNSANLPKSAKILVYPLFCGASLFVIVHAIPIAICQFSVSTLHQ